MPLPKRGLVVMMMLQMMQQLSEDHNATGNVILAIMCQQLFGHCRYLSQHQFMLCNLVVHLLVRALY